MDKDQALKVLIANVVCSRSQEDLTCKDCPLFDENREGKECESFNDEDLTQAVKILKEIRHRG